MNPASLRPGAGVVHLWIAPEWQLDASVEARYRQLMSAEERESEQRFLVEGARRLHVLARGLQRTVLASCLPGAEPAALAFVKNAHGRPALAPPFDASGIEFNIAHTEGMVVMAVCAGMQPGVDIESFGKQAPLAAAVLLGVLSLGLGVLPGPLFERLRTIRPGPSGSTPAPSKGGRGGVADAAFPEGSINPKASMPHHAPGAPGRSLRGNHSGPGSAPA